MIEPYLFDISMISLELTDLWKLATISSSILCVTTWSVGFLIHTVFGFLNDIT